MFASINTIVDLADKRLTQLLIKSYDGVTDITN